MSTYPEHQWRRNRPSFTERCCWLAGGILFFLSAPAGFHLAKQLALALILPETP